MGKYQWDRVEKKYGLCMYFTEALTVLCLILYFLSRDIFIGVLAVLLTVCTATFHIMLQNYSLTRRVVELLDGSCGNIGSKPLASVAGEGNSGVCEGGKDG